MGIVIICGCLTMFLMRGGVCSVSYITAPTISLLQKGVVLLILLCSIVHSSHLLTQYQHQPIFLYLEMLDAIQLGMIPASEYFKCKMKVLWKALNLGSSEVLLQLNQKLNLLSSGHDGTAQFGRVSTCDSSLGAESISYLINPTAINSFRNEQHRKPKKSRKHAETLPREVVMAPMEASMQNQQLPEGYACVPVGCLTKGKSVT